MRPLVDRFWEKVEKSDGCWTWTAAKRDQTGYGCIGTSYNGHRSVISLAHRVSWELHYGPIPMDCCVLHLCDNPSCVNPDHLYLGTQLENARDRETRVRGNHARGERNGNVKLSESVVRQIKALKCDGVGYRKIANQLGLPHCTVYWVTSGRTWKAVEAA